MKVVNQNHGDIKCHLTTDFGIVPRAMRFDNVLAALLETDQLTSRYYLHHDICPPGDRSFHYLPSGSAYHDNPFCF